MEKKKGVVSRQKIAILKALMYAGACQVVTCHVISAWLSLPIRGKWKDEADEINSRDQYT